MMVRALLLFALVSAAQCWNKRTDDMRAEYQEAMAMYGRGLQSLSAESAKAHYQAFVEFSNQVHNNNEDAESTYIAANNKFSIETPEERKQHLGRNATTGLNLVEREEGHFSEEEYLQLIARADNVDYMSLLPPIKNQGGCGSCWTYGAVVPLEYQVNLRSGKDVISFSEQALLDCVYETKNGGGNGCNGGYQDAVYAWMAKTGNRLPFEKDHPYKGKDMKCQYKDLPNGFSGWKVASKIVKYPGDQKLLVAMSKPEMGVLTVAVHVNDAFSSYSSGVFSDSTCTAGVDNHAVAATGYGVRDGVPYFRIRNSWGSDWGEDGYINIKRSITENLNMCRVSEFAEFPVVTKDGSDEEEEEEEEATDGDEVTWTIEKKRKLFGKLGKMNMTMEAAKAKCVETKKCKAVLCKNKNGKCGMRKTATDGKKHNKFTAVIMQRAEEL